MKTVSVFANPRKGAVRHLAAQVIGWLDGHGIEARLPTDLAQTVGRPDLAAEASLVARTDLLVALGGDGTILAAARLVAPHETPILGVNLGRFGFIATAQPNEVEAGLSAYLEGRHLVEERMMIACTVIRDGSEIAGAFALNEFSMHRPFTSAMVDFGVQIDSHRITSYAADGVIVCTPTGSTAYNLSAGGPIVEPTMRAMVLTAISPHSLGARPFVTRPEARVTLTVESRGQALLVADGQMQMPVERGESVAIQRASYCTRLVSLRHDDFYTKLGRRLFYGARPSDTVGVHSV